MRDPVRAIRPPVETWHDVLMVPIRGLFYFVTGLLLCVVALGVLFAITTVAALFMGVAFVPLCIYLAVAAVRDRARR